MKHCYRSGPALFLIFAPLLPGLPGCASAKKEAAAGAAATIPCVACAKRMTTAASTRNWNGKTLPFCGPECEKRFVKNPERFPH